MIMTSVSGHLLEIGFDEKYENWYGVDSKELFHAEIKKTCPKNSQPIKKTLQEQSKTASTLIIWTDCDREGEGIGSEIEDVCLQVNKKLKVLRAHFSEITNSAIFSAINNLQTLNRKAVDAVCARQELDLRIGCAFTRYQTMYIKRHYGRIINEKCISYGPCQFPTLGFVVKRYKEIENFIIEKFWKLHVIHTNNGETVEFIWNRDKLFIKEACEAILKYCKKNPEATVIKVDKKITHKRRPFPLDTVELEKLSSKHLKINAKETMKIAEKLYMQGFISYPRTETQIFPNGLDLSVLVENQTSDSVWGSFANKVLTNGVNPRVGTKSDAAHPPIHPTKYINTLEGNEKRVYELIVRHFLACCSADAVGFETKIEIKIASEQFHTTGLNITEKNYLEIYIYDKWSEKTVPNYTEKQKFIPDSIKMAEGSTTPPSLLKEFDLISLMDKHGIGTDATHAEHIETIKNRNYVFVDGKGYFLPRALGMALVESYDMMGLEMSSPKLRSQLESDLKSICEGGKLKNDVIQNYIMNYKDIYLKVETMMNIFNQAFDKYFRITAAQPEQQPEDANAIIYPSKSYDTKSKKSTKTVKTTKTTKTTSTTKATNTTNTTNTETTKTTRTTKTKRTAEDVPPKCLCGKISDKKTVKLNNANHGRQFYTCPNETGAKCSFFAWVDDSNQNEKRPRTNDGESTTKTNVRKCSVCKSTNHNKRNCPIKPTG